MAVVAAPAVRQAVVDNPATSVAGDADAGEDVLSDDEPHSGSDSDSVGSDLEPRDDAAEEGDAAAPQDKAVVSDSGREELMSAVRAQLPFHLHSDHPVKKDVDEAIAKIAEATLRSVVCKETKRAAEAQALCVLLLLSGSSSRSSTPRRGPVRSEQGYQNGSLLHAHPDSPAHDVQRLARALSGSRRASPQRLSRGPRDRRGGIPAVKNYAYYGAIHCS